MATFKVLSTCPPCIILSTDTQRYIFGMSEGTQRLCVEYKVRLLKVTALCLTSINHPNDIMGLPGLLLTLNDLQKKDLTIIGPHGTRTFYDLIQYFLNRNFFQIKIYEQPNTNQIVESLNFGDVSIQPIWLGSKNVCYLCITPNIPGKFDIEKAKQLNIPKGPLYSQLKQGNSIILEDGTLIQSEQVVDIPELGSHSLIICALQPHESELIDCLVQNPHFIIYQEQQHPPNTIGKHLHVIFHLSPFETIQLPIYQQWISSFGECTQHIFLGEQCTTTSTVPYLAAAQFNNKLHIVCPEFCPNIPLFTQNKCKLNSRINYLSGYNQLQYMLAPQKKRGVVTAEDISLNNNVINEFQETLQNNSEYISSRTQILYPAPPTILDNDNSNNIGDDSLPNNSSSNKSKGNNNTNSHCCSHGDDNNLRSISFLGTGSAIPCKYRNVSGILLTLTPDSRMLLDAGEGSWSQLVHLSTSLPNQNILDVASSLKAIWISHPHADHHLGVIRIIYERKRLLVQNNRIFTPMVIIAPTSVLYLLSDYTKFDPFLTGAYIALPCLLFDDFRFSAKYRPTQEEYELDEAGIKLRDENLAIGTSILNNMGIQSLKNCRVEHCSESYGVAIVTKDQFKIVYSGDTRPCDRLVDLGKNANILIHEATFDDEKLLEAKEKRHSTVSEAVDIGTRMNAHRVILTHYSQRYPSFPPISPIFQKHVILAYDYMMIPCKDIEWAPSYTPTLLVAFPPEEEEEQIEGENIEGGMENANERNRLVGAFAMKVDCQGNSHNSKVVKRKRGTAAAADISAPPP